MDDVTAQPETQPVAQEQPKTTDPIASSPAPSSASTGGVAANYAGFWIRLLALIIDAIILGIVTSILNSVLGFNRAQQQALENALQGGGTGATYFSPASFLSTAINWAYFVGMDVYKGATIGKMALGLRVVNANGEKLDIGKAALREIVGKIVSALPLGLGFIWVGFDAKKQGFHDKIAQTYVVKVR